MAGDDWSAVEVELVVDDYLHMFAAHCAGQQVNRAERRRNLQLKLNNRSDSSVDRKRSNISAVLQKFGFHYLPGYKPLANYQRLLESVVTERIAVSPWLDEAETAAAEMPALAQELVDYSKVVTEAPRRSEQAAEKSFSFTALRRDYVEREARNRSLGRAGEQFVVEFERWRLSELGHAKLAEKVDWVSTSSGDGLGYDVRSFELDGSPKHIEVKTTAFDAPTPFFLSDVELAFSDRNPGSFYLYRVFDFRQQPRLFAIRGSISASCHIDPVSFRASFV